MENMEGCLFSISVALAGTAMIAILAIAIDEGVLKTIATDVALSGLQIMTIASVTFAILFHAVKED